MSNSFDGRDRRGGRPPAPPPHRNRADAAGHDGYDDPYTQDPRRTERRPSQLPAEWQRDAGPVGDPAAGDGYDPRTGDYRDADPMTGPATFDFQPSPLRTGLQPPHRDRRHGQLQPERPPHGSYRDTYPEAPEPEPAPVSAPARRPRDGAGVQPTRHVPEAELGGDLYAPTRGDGAGDKEPANAPIVPAGSVTGRSLTLVIAIMCFLACLTAGAVYMMNQSAAAWLKGIASEVTVQVEAREKTDVDKTVRDVASFLERQPGIRKVEKKSLDYNASLLEPWLGNSEALKSSLPVPRLIALELDRGKPPDFAQLRTALNGQFKDRGVTLDDHRHWQNQIRTVTNSFALGGLAILMLVGAATTSIIVSATKSALAANREIVEVLHFVGATDRFIAREFEKHFLRLGIKAGVVGATCAMLGFLLLPVAMELLGGGTVTNMELRRLVGIGALDLPGYVLLGVVVVVIAALCMLTSRIGVYRILNSQH